MVADKISRKFSVALGYIITSIPFAFFPFVNGLEIFAILFAVKAVGKALVSGADSALLYDTLLEMGEQGQYKKIMTRAGAWTMGVASASMFLGGWMGETQQYNLAFWLPLPLQLIGAAAAIMMIEPDVSKKAKEIQSINYLSHVKGAARAILGSSAVLIPALVFAFLEGTAVNMKWYYPAIFESYGMGLLATGAVMTVLYLGKTLVGVVGPRLIMASPQDNVVRWLVIIAVAWIVAATGVSQTMLVIALMLVLLGLELATNSSEEMVHNNIESKVRATGMSLINMLSSVAATLLLWGWGLANNGLSLRAAVLIQAVIMLVILVIINLERRKIIRHL